jgi:hypothetical protein
VVSDISVERGAALYTSETTRTPWHLKLKELEALETSRTTNPAT